MKWYWGFILGLMMGGGCGVNLHSSTSGSSYWQMENARSEGKRSGEADGKRRGHQDGYAEGYSNGKRTGLEEGEKHGYNRGLREGATKGKKEGIEARDTEWRDALDRIPHDDKRPDWEYRKHLEPNELGRYFEKIVWK